MRQLLLTATFAMASLKMCCFRATGTLLLVLIASVLNVGDASGVIVYRLGTPFSTAERDSLDALGIDFREIDWSASQLLDAVEQDSLLTGSLQPNFFAPDEDIAATLFSRDGFVGAMLQRLTWDERVMALVDQDPTTPFTWPAIAPESFDTLHRHPWAVYLDLGGSFLMREIRLRPLADRPDHFLEGFNIAVSDMQFSAYQRPQEYTTVADVSENTSREISVVLDHPVTTRAIRLMIDRNTPKEIGIADFEVYGGGFVRQASYKSDVIELDAVASLGEIRWSGRRDPLAQVAIRTRAGVDRQPEIFWEIRPEQLDRVKFLQGGGDLNFSEYKNQYGQLPDFLKPQDQQLRATIDTENWSFWSSAYEFDTPGVAFVSPGPRRFMQIEVDFLSTVADGSKIDYIEFMASVPPAVTGLVGEIFPVEAKVGEATHFTYFIKPTIRSGDGSFDGVEISSPSGVVSVDSLRIDGIGQREFSSTLREDGLGVDILLPRRMDPTDSGALVEVAFTALLFREAGNLFAGRVFDSSSPQEVRQRVIPGNATDEIDSDRLSVTTTLSRSLIFSPEIWPNPFTPNGDGVNDVVNISYKLLRVTSAVPISIEIFDLSGRLAKRVYAGEDPLGEYWHIWDGTDNANKLVRPGLYLYRILADAQSELATISGLLSVAY